MSSATLSLLIETIDKSSADIAMIRAEMDKLAVSAAKAEKAATGFGDKMKNVGKGMAKAGAVMTASVTAPIAAGLGASVKAAIDFESAMADVNKVTGLEKGSVEAKAMAKEIMDLSDHLPIAATGLAEIAAAGGQLGIETKDLGGFVETVAQMSVAFDMTADQAGQSIAKMMNLYKLNLDGAEKMGDAINHVSNNSSASANQLVDVGTRIGGMATSFGLTAEEAIGLGSAFIVAGGTAETAGTSINGFLQSLQTAASEPEKFALGLEAIGMSGEELEKSIIDNPVKAIETFLTKLNELDGQARATAMKQMFGKGVDTALLSKLADDVAMYNKQMGLATDTTASAGSMQGEFAARADTTANSLILIQNRLTKLGVTIGDALLPHIRKIVTDLSPAVEKLSDFVEKNPELTETALNFAMIAAAIGPLLVALGTLAASVGAIAKLAMAMKLLTTVPKILMGVASGFKAFGLVLATIGKFALSGIMLLGKGIMIVMTLIAAALGIPVWAAALLVAALVAGAALIIMNWQNIKTFFANLGTSIAEGFSRMKESVGSAFNQLKARAAATFIEMRGKAITAVAGLTAAFQNGVGRVRSAMEGIKSAVTNALTNLISSARSMGTRIVTGIADGIRAGIANVRSAASDVAAAVKNMLPNSPVPEGPLTILNGRQNAGYKIAEMVASGMQAGSGLINNAMSNTADPLNTAASSPVPMPATVGNSTANTFAPSVNITVNGGSADVAGQLDRQMEETFARLYAQYKAQQARVSYG
jgi:TP901 family phage tail tape measure protein